MGMNHVVVEMHPGQDEVHPKQIELVALRR